MSASDELVLDPFAALLSGKQERKAWIRPQRFKAVQRIRSDLEQLVGVEQVQCNCPGLMTVTDILPLASNRLRRSCRPHMQTSTLTSARPSHSSAS